MNICTISLFPELFESFFGTSIVHRAVTENVLTTSHINPRHFSPPPHHHVDDTPYGGGPGMVMKPEPLSAAIDKAKENLSNNTRIIAPSASGRLFTQQDAKRLSKYENLIFLCGRYEGIDQRVLDSSVDEELSIGDYVLMGGEIPSMVMLEAILRHLPGVLGNSESIEEESFSVESLLEAPHYTRPEKFNGVSVPSVLLSGDHKKIAAWKKEQSLARTKERRPDLCTKGKQ